MHKRHLLTFLCVLVSTVHFGQGFGTGIVMIQPSEETSFLYSDQDSLWIKWDSVNAVFETPPLFELDPLDAFTTPSTLFFRCLEKKGDSLKLVLNEGSKKTAWLIRNKSTVELDWFTFLTDTDFIQFDHTFVNTIKSAPNKASEDIESDYCAEYLVLEIKANWIRVKGFDCDNPVDGWVQWNNGQALMVVRMRYE